jgi:hypothetical protein
MLSDKQISEPNFDRFADIATDAFFEMLNRAKVNHAFSSKLDEAATNRLVDDLTALLIRLDRRQQQDTDA